MIKDILVGAIPPTPTLSPASHRLHAVGRSQTASAFWLLLDQALFALTALLLNVLLAQWLTRQQYGFFSVVYAVLLLFSTIHSGLVAEPLPVFATGRFKHSASDYIESAARVHWHVVAAFTALTSTALLLTPVFDVSHYSAAIMGIGAVTPFFLLVAWVRRSYIVQANPRGAALCGASYLFVILAGLSLLRITNMVTEKSALAALACAGIAVALPKGYRRIFGRSDGVATVWKHHLDYGRWALVSSVAAWVPINAQPLLLAQVNGLEAAADFRVFSQLIMPAAQLFMAGGTFLVPLFGAAETESGRSRLALKFSIGALVVGAIYFAAVATIGPKLLQVLYGDRYTVVGSIAYIAGAVPLGMGISIVLASAQRAAEKSSSVARVSGAAALLAVVLSLPAATLFGLKGVSVVLLATQLLSAALFIVEFRRNPRPRGGPRPGAKPFRPKVSSWVVRFLVRCLELGNALVPKTNRIALHSFPDLDDNTLALCEHLRGKHEVVILRGGLSGGALPPGVSAVKKNSLRGIWSFLRCRYVITTHGLFTGLRPLPHQIILNIWHGMPLKAIGRRDKKHMTAPQASLAVATSPFFQQVISDCFQLSKTQVLVTGQPRTDRMMSVAKKGLDKVWGGSTETKTVLWLPTYRVSVRGDCRVDGNAQQNLLSEASLRALDDCCVGSRLRCVIKPHPMAEEYGLQWRGRAVKVITDGHLANSGTSIYELLGTSDILITDISSVFVDFLMLDRPTIFCFADRDEYATARGWSVPDIDLWLQAGPVVTNIEQLCDVLEQRTYSDSIFDARRAQLKALAHTYTDSLATERVLSALLRDSNIPMAR